jgi:FkbH-like protein
VNPQLNPQPTRVELLADFTTGVLARLLEHDPEPPHIEPLERGSAPLLGMLMAAAADEDQPRTVSVVWADPRRSLEGIARADGFHDVDPDAVRTEVDAFVRAIVELAARRRTVLVVRWLPGQDRGLGLIDLHHPQAPGRLIAEADARMLEVFAAVANIHLIDPTPWLIAAGPSPHSERQWWTSKVPYTNAVFAAAARSVRSAVRTLDAGARRIVLLDLDNTLWGGIVGEDGMEGLVLGGHDAKGEAFVAFQRDLQRLTRIGVQLALVSRNDEATALAAFDDHPEMVLRRADLAGWRIGWGDKAEAIASLLDELRLGPASAVFIDDSPAERGRVAEAHPELLVPDWPTNPMLYPSALRALDCFDPATLSREDRGRTASYRAEQSRSDDLASASSREDWLASLGLTLDVRPLDEVDLARAAQLLNKTNQMNLATRRFTDRELADLAARDDARVATVRVSDRYGDAGLTAVVAVELAATPTQVRITDLVVSCRVLGRGVEQQLLHVAAELARDLAAAHGGTADGLIAGFVPTPRNSPCRALLDDSGAVRDGDDYSWDLSGTITAAGGGLEPQPHVRTIGPK